MVGSDDDGALPTTGGRRCSVIVLTMGDRPAELEALVASLAAQVDFEGVLIGNGVEPPRFDGWSHTRIARNVGISAGRREGARASSGEFLVFLDDDAANETPGLLAEIADAFDRDPALGAIALRVVVAGTDRALSEWLPRVRGHGELRSGPVTSFHGAAHAVRADAYHAVGGYHPDFWYAHEETDLAWRLLDAGYTIDYRPDLVLAHPLTKPSRHGKHLWYSARNRVWLARQHLPFGVAALYVSVWLGLQLARSRSLAAAREVTAGTAEGIRVSPGHRRPMSWRTVWRMTRLGRPPIV